MVKFTLCLMVLAMNYTEILYFSITNLLKELQRLNTGSTISATLQNVRVEVYNSVWEMYRKYT
jgi:hypothetical protein